MNLESALAAIKKIIGDDFVQTNNNILEQSATTTYTTDQKICAIILPGSKEELQECVKTANQFKVPLYPTSTGRNWGYGAKVPVTENSILVDLSRLNRILDYNEEMGYVTVEPGVTQGQLFRFLREKKSELIVSTTGGSIESSLIGNVLERGVGTGPYAERLSSVCGFEVVLPDGKIVGTGFRRFGDELASKTFKWGVGPYVDGIFTQSNLGIVTSMTMWLLPCPEHFQLVFYQCDNAQQYYKLLDEVQVLSVNGIIRPTISMFNNYRVISNLTQYPFEHEKELALLSLTDKTKKIKEYAKMDLAKLWTGEISVRGMSKEHADMQSGIIMQRIKPFVDNITVFEVSKEEMLNILNNEAQKPITGTGQELIRNILIRKYLGIPEDNPIRQAYWRKKTPIPADMNPDRDKCGLVWFCPIVPFRGKYADEAVSMIEELSHKYGYEPAISMQCMSERAIHIIASIAWDREVPGEDEKALACYMEVHDKLEEKGYYFYRETTYSMKHREPHSKNYNEFLASIKKALDPANILAPGRYIKT